ncbi:hypothetical protein GALL_460580 [mine drainage metagenome]|uniref:Transmembrane protein n=1 Tax=mine drainage metagenome TaxID=410659 RepID=A0A1J5PXM2_9ZZZZ
MTFAYLSPAALSFLLLAAHFYRANQFLLVAVPLLMLALMALRRRWVPLVLQLALVLGSLEWLRTLVELVMERRAFGQPFLRLSLILGGVALAALLSCLVFRAARLRAHFQR